jgi:hypothetical protein
MQIADAAEAGRLAYLSGRPTKANPFSARSPEAKAWNSLYLLTKERRPTWADDDLAPPPFLRRPAPDRNSPLPAFVLADRAEQKRTWITRDYSPEAIMARIDALIVNPDAPVTVWSRDEQRIAFDNYAAFTDWYRPAVGRFIGANSQATFTDIALDDYRPTLAKPSPAIRRNRSAVSATDAAELGPTNKARKLLGAFPLPIADGSEPQKRGRKPRAAEPVGFVAPADLPPPRSDAKFIREGVTVAIDGGTPTEYRSARQAFTLLSLPAQQCRPFRKALKASGSLQFVHAGKTYDFVVVR